MGKKSTLSKILSHANPLETEAGMLGQAKKTVTSEAKAFNDTFWEQVLGAKKSSHGETVERPATGGLKTAGDVFVGNAMSASDKNPDAAINRNYRFRKQQSEKAPQHEMPKPRRQEARAAIEYHEQFTRQVMDYERKASHQQTQEMSQEIQQIVMELKKLIQSSQALQVQFGEVTVENAPVVIGKYHVSFFEWMLIVIRQAKQKVDDAGAWMSTMKGKNGKKSSGYWDMFKKHGTSFGLSNERSVATQVG